MIKLYRSALSGHCHRVELMMSLLRLDYIIIDVDLENGEHKTDSFLRLNPLAQVPVIDDHGVVIYDSNAILIYLCKKYDDDGQWYPDDPVVAAKIQQWLSLAAGPIASGPARARLITVFGANYSAKEVIAESKRLLFVIDSLLRDKKFLVGDSATIADVALYTYIAHAPEGNISLTPYAYIGRWLRQVESLEGFLDMQDSDVTLEEVMY